MQEIFLIFFFISCHDFLYLINKKKKSWVRVKGKQPAASISCWRTSRFASVPSDLMRLDKPVGAWGAGISCSGSGIIPISLQSDAPNPTSQVHHGGGCPQHCRRNKQHSDDWGVAIQVIFSLSNAPMSGSSLHEFSLLKCSLTLRS